MDLNQLVSKNQTIKIVPSIEDTLRSKGLNVDLDENTKLWLEQLKITWKTWKKSPTIENHIELFFQCSPDPFRVALVFVIKCEEFKDIKPKTLPYFIMETLNKWTQVSKMAPDDHLKMPAFYMAIQQRNQHFLNIVVKTYQLGTKKDKILPIVNEMIKNDNCKQASQIVIAMELFEDIPVEKLLFPLILQDKNNMIDEYLTESPSQVKPLLYFLDSLLDKNFNIREYVQWYIEENTISHVNFDKVHSKPFGKLVARLCNKFKIPIETCKNLSKYRTTGGLRYLIHQKYIENNVSDSVWDDLVKDSLKQNSESGKDFIDMLIDYDRKEALKWAEYLNIPDVHLPLALKTLSVQEPVEDECWDSAVTGQPPQDTQAFYEYTFTDDQIILIDNAEKFYDLMMSDLVNASVVSIDCEWKPSFGATQSQVALIQISTLHNVYLIDTMVLNHQKYASFWNIFHKSFLDNAEIIKLGFGLENDLREVKASVVSLGNIKVKGEGLLDLVLLWKNLIDGGLTLPSNSDNGGKSLSSLVQVCFGLPLEKSEQCSNWELRPLRKTQIKYAALDAHVLIKIYCYLQNLCSEQGIDFEEICNDVMLEGKKKCSAKKIKGPEKIHNVSVFKTVLSQNIKFLVEPGISNLLIYLRYFGVDAILMPTSLLWYDIINKALSEDRYILLAKMKHTPTAKFPQTSILDVGSGTVKDHLQKIFKNFNIKVEQNYILSRCLSCNCQDLKKLEHSEVLDIGNRYNKALEDNSNSHLHYNKYDDDEFDNVDSFLSDSDCDDDHYHPNIVLPSKNISCVTSKGVPIEIDNVQELLVSHNQSYLCESCGKLFWDEDNLLKSVKELDVSFIYVS